MIFRCGRLHWFCPPPNRKFFSLLCPYALPKLPCKKINFFSETNVFSKQYWSTLYAHFASHNAYMKCEMLCTLKWWFGQKKSVLKVCKIWLMRCGTEKCLSAASSCRQQPGCLPISAAVWHLLAFIEPPPFWPQLHGWAAYAGNYEVLEP